MADFVMGDNHLSLLASCNQLVFDTPSEVFRRHSLTTEEIKEFCRDVKVRERRRRRRKGGAVVYVFRTPGIGSSRAASASAMEEKDAAVSG